MQAYLKTLEDMGCVRHVEREVDPRFELAAVVKRSQAESGDAILFSNVKGCKLPVISNVYGDDARLSAILGVTPENFGEGWWQAMQRLPEMSGRAFNVLEADQDLVEMKFSDLPQIIWHEKNVGPYISAGIFYARDPETGIGNLSFCRSLMIDNGLISCFVAFHDLAQYQQKAEALGRELEVAVLLGPPPEVFLAACASLPIDADEMEFAAAIRGAPIDMRRCRTIDLEVPADTQIVLEGRVRLKDRGAEGPFGEFMGFYGVRNENGYIVDISAVDALPNAVYHGLLCGSPEDLVPLNRAFAARAYTALRQIMPDVVLEVVGNPILQSLVVRIRKTDDALPLEVIRKTFAHASRWTALCIVVDEDVNPHDLHDVMHGYVTRGRVDDRVHILDGGDTARGRVGIDATTPMENRHRTERTRIPGEDKINLRDYFS